MEKLEHLRFSQITLMLEATDQLLYAFSFQFNLFSA